MFLAKAPLLVLQLSSYNPVLPFPPHSSDLSSTTPLSTPPSAFPCLDPLPFPSNSTKTPKFHLPLKFHSSHEPGM